jgi:hypothetical protein
MKLNKAVWIIIILSALVSGCTTIPVGKYNSLNTSSTDILKNTSETYTRIEKLQRKFIVASALDKKIDRDTFKPVIDGTSFDITPELRFREDAIEVLVKYTNVLASLASKDYQKDVDTAATDLAGSLKNLSSSAKLSASGDVPGVIAALVDVVGKQIVEHKRKDALVNVMDNSQKHVDLLAKLVVGSNDKIKQIVGQMENRLIAHANIARPKYESSDRYEFDLKIADTIAEVEEINNALDNINAAMIQYPKAHAEIRALLDKKETKLDALELLVKEAQRANKLYRSIKK